MVRRLTRMRRRRRGAVAVVVALCLVPLIGVMAFTFDGGLLLAAKRRSQTVADTSALAAAVRLYANKLSDPTGLDVSGNAKSNAISLAATNGYNNDGTTNSVKVNFSPSISVTAYNKPYYAEVIVTTIQPRIFAAVFGSGSLTLTARAIARGITAGSQTYSNASLITLGASNGANALQVTGGAALNAESSIQDNSSNATAFSASNGAYVKASSIQVTGGSSVTGGSTVNGTVQTAAPAIPDPLANVPIPDPSTLTPQTFTSSYKNQTLQPGVYANGITMGNGATNILSPGIYYIKGSGLNVGNGVTLTGTGVTIYMDSGAQLTLQGGTSVTLTPPTSGTYAGLTYFQNRTNKLALSISNGTTFKASGTIYAPAANATINGGTSNKYGSQLIVDTFNLSNGASVTLPTKTDSAQGYVASGQSVPSITLVY